MGSWMVRRCNFLSVRKKTCHKNFMELGSIFRSWCKCHFPDSLAEQNVENFYEFVEMCIFSVDSPAVFCRSLVISKVKMKEKQCCTVPFVWKCVFTFVKWLQKMPGKTTFLPNFHLILGRQILATNHIGLKLNFKHVSFSCLPCRSILAKQGESNFSVFFNNIFFADFVTSTVCSLKRTKISAPVVPKKLTFGYSAWQYFGLIFWLR